jgi:hypothetical protein
VGLPGTAFPLACCGGIATVTATTTFTAGDNNVFGLFTRSASCSLNIGLRAPVVISISPSDGNCAVGQNTIITGACFVFSTGSSTVTNVTRVFAVERRADGTLNTANTINATRFVILASSLIDAFFEFGTVNAGKTFLIFVSGPNGTSRNLLAGDSRPAGCPTGNEQGVQVSFTCLTQPPAPCVPNDPRPECQTPPPPPPARVTGCNLNRSSSGVFTLTVTGSNIKSTATVTVNGQAPKKVKFQDQQSNGTFNTLKLKGKLCANLPGTIVVNNNDGTGPSAPFVCTERCPSQQ